MHRLRFSVPGGRASQDGALTAAEGRVPKRQNLGEGGDFAILSVRRVQGTGAGRVVVDVTGPPGVDLFAEGQPKLPEKPAAKPAEPVPPAPSPSPDPRPGRKLLPVAVDVVVALDV